MDVISRELPDLHTEIRQFNAAPVLFTDVCGSGILFGGARREGDRVRYEEIYGEYRPAELMGQSDHNTPSDLQLFDAMVASLQQGDQLRYEPDLLTVEALGRQIAAFERPSHLHWQLLSFD